MPIFAESMAHLFDSLKDGKPRRDLYASLANMEYQSMKSKLLHEETGLRTFALVFDKNDEVQDQLLKFADLNRFADAHLTAIGAFSEIARRVF